MLNYIKTYLLLFLCLNLANAYAQDIEIFIDIGKTEFEYREKIFAKVQVVNNTIGEINLEDWCGFDAPYVNFELENNNHDNFHYWGLNIDCFRTNKFYFLKSSTDIKFPLTSFYRLDFGPILAVGEYKLSGSIVIAKKKYSIKPIEFKIIPPIYKSAELKFINAEKLERTVVNTAFKMYRNVFEQYPKSIISVAAMNKILFLLNHTDRFQSNYKAVLDTLKKEMLEHYVKYFDNNRYAFITVKRTITSYRSKDRENMLIERLSKFKNFLNQITNEELKKELNSSINKIQGNIYHPSNIRIEEIKKSIF